MKRSNELTTARVYAYGCGDPLDGFEFAQAEMAMQRAMWDALVASDRKAERAQEQAARTVPEIDAALAEIDRLSNEIDEAVKARRAARARMRAKVDTPEIDARIGDLAQARRDARKALWPLLSAWRKDNKDALKKIEDVRRAEAKQIRQGSGLHWSNYNRVVDSFERARKLSRKTGGRPRFSDAGRDDGVLTIQIQRTTSGLGASMAELLSGRFNPLQIAPVDPRAFDASVPRGERSRLARTELDMRVDAAGHRIRLPMTLHRLPPPGTRIKSAQLTWHREGERLRWQLALTAVEPSVETVHRSTTAVGIDVGWRLQPDGSLLFATAWDGCRYTRYVLPREWMAGMDQVERLASHVDDGLIEIARHYHERPDDLVALPDDLRMPLMGWRPKLGARHVNAQSLHDAIRARIRSAAPGVRADVPEPLRAWYDRYRHLALWRDDLRAKLGRRRREIYRLAAKEIAERYALIGVEKIDLAEMAKTRRRNPEDPDNPLFQAARAQRVRAGVYAFGVELRHQSAKSGAEIAEVVGPSTMQCGKCGEKTGQRDRSQRVWLCEHCGAVWDQDHNAARNIYAAAVGDASGLVVRLSA